MKSEEESGGQGMEGPGEDVMEIRGSVGDVGVNLGSGWDFGGG